MNREACAYQTANNLILIVFKANIPIFGMVMPYEDKTTFTQDLKRLKQGDIPLCASVLSPIDSYKITENNNAHFTLYEDGSSQGYGSGESYYNG